MNRILLFILLLLPFVIADASDVIYEGIIVFGNTTDISTADHGALGGLGDDDHPLYLTSGEINDSIKSNVSAEYVPYTGANQDIDLGSQDVITTGEINGTRLGGGNTIVENNQVRFNDDILLVGEDGNNVKFDPNAFLVSSFVLTVTNSLAIADDVFMRDEELFIFGDGAEATFVSETSGTDHLQVGLQGFSVASNYFNIVDSADLGIANRNPEIATPSDPILRIYSADGNQPNDWWQITHDRQNAEMNWGNGLLSFNSSMITFSPEGDANFTGNVTTDSLITTNLSVESGNATFEEDIVFPNLDSRLCWSDRCLTSPSGGALVYSVTNGVNDPRISLRNNQGTAQILFFYAGQSDRVSLIPAAGYDYYMFENAGAGENKVVRQYGRVGGSAEYIGWQVASDGWFNLSRGNTNIQGHRILMPTDIVGNLNQTKGNFTGNNIYAEMYNYTGFTNPFTYYIPAISTYYNLTNFTSGNINGFEFTDENVGFGGSYLTALVAGMYDIDFTFSFAGTVAGSEYGITVATDFDETSNRNCYARRTITGTSIGNLGIECLVNLDVGETINVMIEDEGATARNIQIHATNLNIKRVGN